jgi:pseudouridylate synthase
MFKPHFSPEVASALASNQPIVALESTIITHGMPWPQNVETAFEVEQAIRKEGAVPATIAILNGVMKAGLTTYEMEMLGKQKNVMKTSRRDLPYVLATKQFGSTTVATTMIIAEMTGIQIFATGGIGGVHRGAEMTMDISADLQELARTNVAVVSAGAKAILDLGLTLEYLETMGVPVVGYKTDEFPAFYSRKSGFKTPLTCHSSFEIAQLLETKWKMGLNGGVLIANPIPEEYSIPNEEIEAAIQIALAKAKQQSIFGKELTPFLLGAIKEITAGKSLDANIQLILNNAQLAGEIALKLAGLEKK